LLFLHAGELFLSHLNDSISLFFVTFIRN